MREEIEAAALFITRLVNKNLSQSGSIASSIHSHSSSSSSASSSSSESPPDLDEHNNASSTTTANTSSSSTTTLVGTTSNPSTTTTTSLTNSALSTTANNGCNNVANSNSIANDQDKAEQFRQCLEEALYERFHNHWFPEQPTKGQAYRCIRLNEWDRHDTTLQKACSQCGIDYKDLQLPVELTLWVDPDEVTCRFGENKGSHCLVAKFKDGELKDNNFNIDINNIDIEIFHQNAAERTRQQSMHDSPEYNNSNFYAKYMHNNRMNGNNMSINNNHHQQGGYHFFQNGNHHHQSPQHHNHHHQAPQQQTPPHQHRANLGKAPMMPAYHHNYPNGCDTNGNPIYYYF